MKRVAVLRGGPSEEYSVSMQTGAAVLAALVPNKHYVVKDIIISKRGEWLDNGIARNPERILDTIDVVFLALHGSFGEDGSVQKILERNCIPFTGSRAFASGLALNKILTKDFLKKHGISMPKHFKVTRGEGSVHKTAETIQQLFGPQYVIKPLASGSSLGARMVNDATELPAALLVALDEHPELIVEERISGREATVALFENYRGEPHYLFPEVEIIPPNTSEFFSYDVKYNGTTREICPGGFTANEKQALRDIAKLVHTELGLQQYSRSDFIVAGGVPYFLEVNTLPGLTPESLLPKAVAAVGGTYEEMITHLIETARV